MDDMTEIVKSLEHRFWQALVDNDADVAVDLLCEPAMMVSARGSMKFDHAGFIRMMHNGTMMLHSFTIGGMDALVPNDTTVILSYDVTQTVTGRGTERRIQQQMRDTSTWVRQGSAWKCAIHTETPVTT